jgi:hypothetical protein
MYGSSFVSGGRQLGKSALLRHAARTFNEASSNHVAIVMSIYRVGKRNDPEQVWSVLWPELANYGIVEGPIAESNVADTVHAKVRAWIAANPSRQLLLLLDEADDFLDADAHGNRFDNVEWFRRLMLETERRVKVVLAGLHRTARFESLPNQPLPHLGKPIVVGPLRPQHPRDLLTQPLVAIGYTFDNEITVARVLAGANNMAAQLQLIGAALVEHMDNRPLDTSGPPTQITSDDVTSAFTPKLREALREKFTLTLTLDPRYKVIAYVVAAAAHERGSDTTLSLGELSAECRGAWPEAFAELGADAFRGLVAECVDLGVLARDANRFRLRTPSIRRLLGTELEVFEELASASDMLAVPATYDGAVYRRLIASLDNAISPLTERQLGSLFSEGRAVIVVAGSPATGLNNVIATIDEVASTMQHGGDPIRCSNARPEGVTAAIGRAATQTRLLVDARTTTPAKLAAMIDAAEAATALTNHKVTTIFVAGPASAATWVTYPNRLELERVDSDGMRLLAGADVLPFHDQIPQDRVIAELGGWLCHLSSLTDLFRGPGKRHTSNELVDHVVKDAHAHAGVLAAAVGTNPRASSALLVALGLVADLTSTTHEDLDTLAELLEETGEVALNHAMVSDGFASPRQVLDALVALGALSSDGAGRWAPEKALAGDIARARA